MLTADRVAKSSALLDTKGPANWRTLIDWDRLDILDCSLCPLGQLYGDYFVGLRKLDIGEADEEYAFFCFSEEAREVEAAWRAHIKAEKQARSEDSLLDELVERRDLMVQESDELFARRRAVDAEINRYTAWLRDINIAINALSD